MTARHPRLCALISAAAIALCCAPAAAKPCRFPVAGYFDSPGMYGTNGTERNAVATEAEMQSPDPGDDSITLGAASNPKMTVLRAVPAAKWMHDFAAFLATRPASRKDPIERGTLIEARLPTGKIAWLVMGGDINLGAPLPAPSCTIGGGG